MSTEVSKNTAVGVGVCGVFLLVCGFGCIIPGFILVGIGDSNADGLWSGVMCLFAGALGVVTWWKRNRGVITGFLIVTICVILAAFIQSIIAGTRYSDYKSNSNSYRGCYWKDATCYCKSEYGLSDKTSKDFYCNKSKKDTLIGSLLAIIIFIVIGGIAAFTGSIFGCMGTCSVQSQPGTVIVQRPVVVTTTTLPGYSVQQPGYLVQQPGYSVQQPGYSVQQPGYSVQQPGHQVPQPGYQAPQSDYQAPQSSYQAPQSGYQAPGSDYQAPQSGYQAPQPADATPQASSTQQQVPNDPPPEYTKHAL